jgi:hypothetical protein
MDNEKLSFFKRELSIVIEAPNPAPLGFLVGMESRAFLWDNR